MRYFSKIENSNYYKKQRKFEILKIFYQKKKIVATHFFNGIFFFFFFIVTLKIRNFQVYQNSRKSIPRWLIEIYKHKTTLIEQNI